MLVVDNIFFLSLCIGLDVLFHLFQSTKDCMFCRCDICSRLKDLGYESRSDYYDAIHQKNLRETEKTRSVMKRLECMRDDGDSKSSQSLYESSSTLGGPSPKLSPSRRSALPRTAGRVMARHNILGHEKSTPSTTSTTSPAPPLPLPSSDQTTSTTSDPSTPTKSARSSPRSSSRSSSRSRPT